jgi:hypothetical protein
MLPEMRPELLKQMSEASDGVVHVIDGVLWPKDPSKNEAANRMNNPNTGNTNTGNTNTRNQ